ncbi:hypothetical protein K7X08_012776 [Anisodus acutangulus]|uniref:Uncharacterized protein n=1 Tax=Anisodus acutangulus TaxID=402998 RepID=A0A9Q1MBQ2_9SOLA|nr:hypothetical protein K7X08_012776 [Anisodus acutangulus]
MNGVLPAPNRRLSMLGQVRPGEKEISNNLDWAISEMLKNPSVLQKAQQRSKQVFSAYGYVDETYFDELKYLRSVIL